MYKSINHDFYHNQLFSRNPLRRWFHHTRYAISNKLINERYRPGMKVLDLGCGSCDWNVDKIPVVGVDLNEKLLSYGKEQGRLIDFQVSSAAHTKLTAASCDIITAFEFLEHVPDYRSVIKEMYRLLKPGGYIIISVPYDTILSLWRPLFFLQVIYQGYLKADYYYRKRCGHINYFNPRKLLKEFHNSNLAVEKLYSHYRFNIFLIARKTAAV